MAIVSIKKGADIRVFFGLCAPAKDLNYTKKIYEYIKLNFY